MLNQLLYKKVLNDSKELNVPKELVRLLERDIDVHNHYTIHKFNEVYKYVTTNGIDISLDTFKYMILQHAYPESLDYFLDGLSLGMGEKHLSKLVNSRYDENISCVLEGYMMKLSDDKLDMLAQSKEPAYTLKAFKNNLDIDKIEKISSYYDGNIYYDAVVLGMDDENLSILGYILDNDEEHFAEDFVELYKIGARDHLYLYRDILDDDKYRKAYDLKKYLTMALYIDIPKQLLDEYYKSDFESRLAQHINMIYGLDTKDIIIGDNATSYYNQTFNHVLAKAININMEDKYIQLLTNMDLSVADQYYIPLYLFGVEYSLLEKLVNMDSSTAYWFMDVILHRNLTASDKEFILRSENISVDALTNIYKRCISKITPVYELLERGVPEDYIYYYTIGESVGMKISDIKDFIKIPESFMNTYKDFFSKGFFINTEVKEWITSIIRDYGEDNESQCNDMLLKAYRSLLAGVHEDEVMKYIDVDMDYDYRISYNYSDAIEMFAPKDIVANILSYDYNPRYVQSYFKDYMNKVCNKDYIINTLKDKGIYLQPNLISKLV